MEIESKKRVFKGIGILSIFGVVASWGLLATDTVSRLLTMWQIFSELTGAFVFIFLYIAGLFFLFLIIYFVLYICDRLFMDAYREKKRIEGIKGRNFGNASVRAAIDKIMCYSPFGEGVSSNDSRKFNALGRKILDYARSGDLFIWGIDMATWHSSIIAPHDLEKLQLEFILEKSHDGLYARDIRLKDDTGAIYEHCTFDFENLQKCFSTTGL